MKGEMVIYLILGFLISFNLATWTITTKSAMNGAISIFTIIALGLFINVVMNKVEGANDKMLGKWGMIVLVISIAIVLFFVIVGLLNITIYDMFAFMR